MADRGEAKDGGNRSGTYRRSIPGVAGDATTLVTPWTAQDKATFLDALAATANVTRAARSIGRTAQAAHSVRRRDADFAADWAVAMEAACVKLQGDLIEHAMGDAEDNGGEDGGACPACGVMRGRPFDPALALQILRQRAALDGRPHAQSKASYRPVPIAEIEASLTAKIARIVAARKSRARKARADKVAAGGVAAAKVAAGKVAVRTVSARKVAAGRVVAGVVVAKIERTRG